MNQLFSLIADNDVRTLNKFWSYLTASASLQDYADYGAIFQLHNVSPVPLCLLDSAVGTGEEANEFTVNSTPPTFVWRVLRGHTSAAQQAKDPLNIPPVGNLLDVFHIKCYGNTGNSIGVVNLSDDDLLDVSKLFGAGAVAYTMELEMWATIVAVAGMKRYTISGGWWAPTLGRYWSDMHEFEIK